MSEPLSTERLAKIKERIEIASQEFYADKKSLIFEDLTIVVSELDRITRWRNIAEEQPEPGQLIAAMYGSDSEYTYCGRYKDGCVVFVRIDGCNDWKEKEHFDYWHPVSNFILPPLPKENKQ